MIARRRGSIVNIASIAGMRSMPLHAYGPAKAAVIAITECLAAEWGPSGIRINAVSPGYTLTPALKNAIDKGERDTVRAHGQRRAAPAGCAGGNRARGGVPGVGRRIRHDRRQCSRRLRLARRHLVEHLWRSEGGG